MDDAQEPIGPGNEPIPAAARGQSRALVCLGQGSVRCGPRQRQAGAAVHRLLRLPLVPCHGARILRGCGHGGADERAVRQHQGGSRRTARHRQDLPVRPPGAHTTRRWLAADDVPDARRPEAFLRRHLFSRQGALRHAGVLHASQARRRVLPRSARRTARAERHVDGCIRRPHADPGRWQCRADVGAARGRARTIERRLSTSAMAGSATRRSFRTPRRSTA